MIRNNLTAISYNNRQHRAISASVKLDFSISRYQNKWSCYHYVTPIDCTAILRVKSQFCIGSLLPSLLPIPISYTLDITYYTSYCDQESSLSAAGDGLPDGRTAGCRGHKRPHDAGRPASVLMAFLQLLESSWSPTLVQLSLRHHEACATPAVTDGRGKH